MLFSRLSLSSSSLSIIAFLIALLLDSSRATGIDESGYSCYHYQRVETTVITATTDESANTRKTECIPTPQIPSLNIEQIALCLRYGCEINRCLQKGVQSDASIHDDYYAEDSHYHGGLNTNRGGGQVAIHPSQCYYPPIPPSSSSSSQQRYDDEQQQLTIFHEKYPIREDEMDNDNCPVVVGSSRWGMELHTYLDQITSALSIKDDKLVLSLAMVYLDRACSTETSRSNNNEKGPCPFCSARTVHRLILTSLIIATKAVHSHRTTSVYDAVSFLGIPNSELETMEHLMTVELGDNGLYVSSQELQAFKNNWERIWKRLKVRRVVKKTSA